MKRDSLSGLEAQAPQPRVPPGAQGSHTARRALNETRRPRRWSQRWRRILARLQVVDDEAGRLALLRLLARPAMLPERPQVLAFVNAHAMNLAAASPEFGAQLAQVDMLLRDGLGMATLMRWRGIAPGLNMNGTDFIPDLLQACDGQAIVVLGTKEPHLGRGVEVIARRLMPCSRVQALDGFAPTQAYVDLVQSRRPRLVLLAMGMPRQEEVALALRDALDYPCLIVCGGAIVDFLGGKVTRAPMALRRLGMEWLWRLAQEPVRLFRRYVIGNPVFLLRAAWLACRRR